MIPVSVPSIGPLEIKYVRDAIESGWVSWRGPYVTRLQLQIAEHFEVNPELVVLCSSGTAALHISILALGIGRGDQVIVPALTFAATAAAPIHAGAEVVFCDVENGHLDWKEAAKKAGAQTRAVIPVHLYGEMCPIPFDTSENYCKTIVDACEAFHIPPEGDATVYSFFANKQLTMGEGGVAIARDREVARKMRLYRDGGFVPGEEYDHEVAGLNYRLTNVHAAIGCAQMERIDELMGERQAVVDYYKRHLDGIGNWLFAVRVPPERLVNTALHLQQRGIETRPVFKPLPGQKAFPDTSQYPEAWRFYESHLCLPTGPHVSAEQAEQIVDLLKRIL